jgi:RNA recognition motif-containing protein
MMIYISNLDNNLNDGDLRALFQPYGEVLSAQIQSDVFTGVSRGFGYVEMKDDEAALKAIQELNHTTVQGLKLSVSQAQPKQVQRGSYKVGNGPVNPYQFRKNRK